MEKKPSMGKSMVGDDIFGSSLSELAMSVGRRELEDKKKENDPGFWRTFGRKTVDSSIILHGGGQILDKVVRVAKKHFHGDDFSDYAEEGYDWREVAEKYAGQIPQEVFEGSRSSVETDARLREYENDSYARMAMEDRPVASFLDSWRVSAQTLWR
jgi:hypothetical protein